MTTVFATIALILGVVRLMMFISLHLVPSDYNIVEHAVSDYAVGRTRALSSIMTWTMAAFWAALAIAVDTGFPNWSDRAGITACLLTLAAIFVALPFLPADLEGRKPTATGRIHLLAAVVWFALGYACMGNFIRLLVPFVPAALGSTLVIASWVALISLVGLVAALLIWPLRRYAFGIVERIFLLAVSIFYIAVAIGVKCLAVVA